MDTDVPIKRILYLIYQKGVSDTRNQLIEEFIEDLYQYTLNMETKGLCSVLMDLT